MSHGASDTYGGEWARVSTLLVGVVAGLFALIAPVHAVFLDGAAQVVMPVVAAVSAVVLGCAAAAMRLRPALVDATWWMPALAVVPLVNGLTHLGVTGQVEQTTTVMMTFVAIGAVVGDRRAALTLVAAGCLVWVALVATTVDAEDRLVTHYALHLTSASLIAAGIHTVRTMRESRLRAATAERLASDVRQAADAERYRGLFDASPVGMSLSDEHGRFVTANPALCAMIGRSEQELIGQTAASFTHESDLIPHDRAAQLVRESPDGVIQLERRYLRPDGSVVRAWLTERHTVGPGGETWTLAHVQDVTQRRAAEQELRGLEADLTAIAMVARRIRTGEPARPAVVAAARDVVGAHAVHLAEPAGPDALVVTASAGDRDLTGERVPLDGTSMTAHVFRSGEAVFVGDTATHPSVSPRLHALSGGGPMLWQPVLAGGVVIAVLISTFGTHQVTLSDRRRKAMALLADEAAVALEHERVLDELQRRAQTDALTGLPNRRTWDHELEGLLARARRFDRPLTVAVADLDHFKRFNDTHGHATGDAHLLAFATAARRALRDIDVMARWGGEEFTIALPECEGEAAALALERVRAAVPGDETCSIGHATWDGVETAAALLARADAALYAAKAGGRDRLVGDRDIPQPRLEPGSG